VIDLAGASIEPRREAALVELRALVAQLDREHDERNELSFPHSVRQLFDSWAMVWLPALACALTLLVAVVCSATVAYAFAAAETAGALVLRVKPVSRPWRRRWLYGVVIAVLLIATA
jgi:hypothetical protein